MASARGSGTTARQGKYTVAAVPARHLGNLNDDTSTIHDTTISHNNTIRENDTEIRQKNDTT